MAQKISRKIGEGKQKKVLSLVLCVAMMLSVMVVGAGAAFSDQSKIKNTEAVDACTALNIIGGYPDGSFKPEGNITRAEVTKMICVALNGGKNPAVSTNTTPTFSDVRGNANAAWAEGYIESCAAQGIVSGVGGGKFAPNGNVTGVQLAKMLLVSLGYKSENEGFTGNAWATNVNVRAAQKGLYVGLESMDTNAAITRDNAAQMVWNALNAYEVEYKTTLVTDKNGQLSSQITLQDKVVGSTNDKITLMEDKYDAKTFVGTFEGNSKVLSLKDGQIQVTDNDATGTAQKEAVFTYDLDLKYIGEEVKVLYKDNVNDGQKGKLDDKDTIYGVYVTGGTSVINATLNDIDDDYDTAEKVSVNDKNYKVAKEGKVVTNLVNATTGSTWSTKAAGKTAIQNLHKVNGDAVKFVLNDSNEIISAYVTTSDLYKVTAVSGKKVSLAGIGTIDTAENDTTVYSGIAKDDVVVATALYSTNKNDATYVITKAESVAGKVTGYAGTKNVTMDGKTYKFYNETSLKQNLTDDSVDKFITDHVDDSFTLYLVNGYVRAAQKGDEDMNSYALVTDLNSGKLDSTFDEPKAELLLADGTKKTVVLHKDSKIYTDASHGLETLLNKSTPINSTNALDKGTLVKYVEMSNGQYKIEECGTYATTTSTTTEMYNKDTKTFTTGGTKTVTDGNCALFYTNSSNEYKAANIRNLNTFSVVKDKAYAYVTNSDGKVVAAFIDMSAKPSGAASETLYGIITNDGTVTNKNGDTYTMYNIWTGKDTVVYVDGDQKNASDVALAKGQLVSFDESANQTYTQDKAGTHDFTILDGTATVPAKGQAIAVTDYNEKDKTITFATKLKVDGDAYVADGKITKAIDNDVKIVYINADKDKAGDDGMGITSFDGTTGYANALIVYEDNNTDKKVVAIIVNTNSDTDVLGNKTIASAKSVTKPADGTGYTVSVDKTKAVKGDVITLTFTSTVAAGATADTLTVTAAGATVEPTSATAVTFDANAKVGTVKTLKFVANGSTDVSFTISGSVVEG